MQDSIKTQVNPKKICQNSKHSDKKFTNKNKKVYKILLETQLKENPISYIKWGTS